MFQYKTVLFLILAVVINFSLSAGDDDSDGRNGCQQFDGSSAYSTRLISARNIRATLSFSSSAVEVQRNGALERTIPAGNTVTMGGGSGDQFNFNAVSDEGIIGEICVF